MRAHLAVGLAVASLAAPATARAAPPFRPPQRPVLEVATDPEHPGPAFQESPEGPGSPYRYRRSRSGITAAAHLSGGVTRQKYSSDGVYGRLQFRGMIHDEDEPGSLGVVTPLGVDFWRARDGWGFGMPFDFGLGYATPHVLLYGTLGWSLFTIDNERNKTGFGVFSPLAHQDQRYPADPDGRGDRADLSIKKGP
jgi:hypothetical protein